MSVRAYKVIKIQTKEGETFNLWHDEGLMAYLEREAGSGGINDDGCGLWDIPIEVLKRALTEANMDDDTREAIRADVGEAEAEGEDCITYYCY